ncbi:acyltransferase family protein [Paraburkholderia megapolitana]|uniref:acyltransferase family protein n=1 Tax=Paraburkholderia megapolitana TaxID=420953 RepID=UPI000B8784C3|nr:acyltransferase [Paraburkholderia megapolitana]QDQ83137.1 acyltransferase [Paraburkholderia megapolitana]
MSRGYKNLPSLTGGRGVAALLVAVHHGCLTWGGALVPIGNVGWLGVTYFFILSGFVLTWAFSPDRSYREFILYRIARIYPLHLVTLLVSLAFFAIFGHALGGYIGTRVGTVTQFFLIHDFVPGHPEIRQSWNGVSWSLSAEFFFYLLAPWFISRLNRIKEENLIRIGQALYFLHLTIGVVASSFQFPQVLDFMQYHPIAYMPTFIYGIVAAIFIQRGFEFSPNTGTKLMLFVPIFFYVYHNEVRNAIVMIDLCTPAFLAIIIGGATDDLKGKRTILSHGLIEKIGEASFSLYMTHALLLGVMAAVFHKFGMESHPSLKILIFLICSLLLSRLVYLWVELPSRKWFLVVVGLGRSKKQVLYSAK